MSWRTVSLGEVANVGAGNSAPQDECLFTNGTHNFYRTSDVGRIRTGVISESSDKLNQEGIRGLKLHSTGTILFPKSGASTFLNHRVMLGKEGYVSSHLATIKAKDDVVDDKFLLYFLSTIDAKNLVQDSNYPSLKTSVIEKILFSLPPLSTQQKIVSKLDAIFAEIDRATAAAEANVKNADLFLTTELNTAFRQLEEKAKIVEIKSVCDSLHQGLNAQGEKVVFQDNGYPIIQTRNIQAGQIDVTENLKFLSQTDWLKYKKKYRPKLNDIFFTNRGTIGKTAIVTEESDYLIHWNIFKLTPNPLIVISQYVHFALINLVNSGYFYELQKGSTVSFVSTKMMCEAKIPLPSLEEQKIFINKFNHIFTNIQKLVDINNAKITELQSLRQSILRQAFAGELVKE